MLTIGVDPGMSGAIAIVEKDRLVQVFDMPTVEMSVNGKAKRRISPEMLVSEIGMYAQHASAVYIERVTAMPGQGVTSMFAFGEALGLVRGVFAGLLVPQTLVLPQVWKRALKVPTGKDGSRAMAAQLWPLNASEFKRVKDDGRAEAALIALWGSRQ